ncbi:MAG TPA: type II toxin-antitoxin system VapB family antitoxin [Thermoanaerobaculia bacterium]|nr:type II toxin-antitoxin system VapB family antitoxin [Thermoanaerobaculia bacterium]
MPTARVFWSGNSQAVRLPKGFRFAPGTDEVAIRQEGETLILEPIPRRVWPEEFWQAFDGMPDGFERPRQIEQRREELGP